MRALIRLAIVPAALVFSSLIFSSLATAADTFSVGQKVEVREGDTWSTASVLAHEGRKYQVHYEGADASNDEWVTPDRVRAISATGAATPAPTPATAGHPTTSPAKSDKPDPTAAFKTGEKIEAKWGGLWRAAVVVRKQNGWTLVLYDNVWYEWIQPWRLRKVGSDTDTKLDSQPRGFVSKSTHAPTDPPDAPATDADGEPTKPAEDAFHISDTTGPGGIAITKPELTGHDVDPSSLVKSTGPDPAPTCSPPRMLSLNHGTPTGGVTTNLVVNPQGKFALLSFTPFTGDDAVAIQRIELARADANPIVRLAPKLLPLAISPDGKRVITRSEKFFPETKWRMDLWNVDSTPPKALLSFRAYDPGQNENGSDAILWASYLDATHVLTCSGGHCVTLWQISDTAAKEIYTLQGDATVHPQMSPGGKYFIVGYGGLALVCEAMTGNCVARSPATTDTDGMVATLNPDLSRLVLTGGRRLVICDLVNQKILTDLGLPEGVTGRSVNWVGSNLLLLDNRWVFDTDHLAMLWEYTVQGFQPMSQYVGDRLWYLGESGAGFSAGGGKLVFNSMPLVDAKVLAAQKQLTDADYVVQPGSRLSLEVNVDCSAEDHQKIVDTLTKRLKAAGVTVEDGQPIKLVAEKKTVDSHQVTYQSHGFGQNQNAETVTVSDTMQSLSFVQDSKPIWTINSKISGSAPMIVWHKKDKSIADTLNEQHPPNVLWFLNASFPKLIVKPTEPAGSSPLGIAGGGRTRPPRVGPADTVHP